MSCARCGGLTVVEQLSDLLEAESPIEMDAIRCLNCGNFEDAIIRANRVGPIGPRRTARHRLGTRTTSMEGLIAEYPHDHALRSSGRASSTTRIAFESAQAEQCGPLV